MWYGIVRTYPCRADMAGGLVCIVIPFWWIKLRKNTAGKFECCCNIRNCRMGLSDPDGTTFEICYFEYCGGVIAGYWRLILFIKGDKQKWWTKNHESEKKLDFYSWIAYTNTTDMILLCVYTYWYLGWSQDPGPPIGG